MIEPKIEMLFPNDGKTTFCRADVSRAIAEYLGDGEVVSRHDICAGQVIRQGINSGMIKRLKSRIYQRSSPYSAFGEWIFCRDRQPAIPGSYLTWNGSRVIQVGFHEGRWDCSFYRKITHWMSLPAAPQSVEWP